MDTHLIIPRILTGLLSIFQASRLRDCVYTQAQRIQSLELAIEDIERINAHSDQPNRLIANICQHTSRD